MWDVEKIKNRFEEELTPHGLFIKRNDIDDIFRLYVSNEEFARISGSFPVKRENVISDFEEIPPFFDSQQVSYLSIYDQDGLIAVVNFVDGYRFRDRNTVRTTEACDRNTEAGGRFLDMQKDTVWIGLLQIDGQQHGKGWGSIIEKCLESACQKSGKRALQIGVIKENQTAERFWKSRGFSVLAETDNGLWIMEKRL